MSEGKIEKAIREVLRTEIEEQIEEKWNQKFRNDNGIFHLDYYKLRDYGRAIIKYLIEELANCKAELRKASK